MVTRGDNCVKEVSLETTDPLVHFLFSQHRNDGFLCFIEFFSFFLYIFYTSFLFLFLYIHVLPVLGIFLLFICVS